MTTLEDLISYPLFAIGLFILFLLFLGACALFMGIWDWFLSLDSEAGNGA